MSVVVPTVAPAASPYESGQSHPGPGYAGPRKARVDLGTRGSFGAWPAAGGCGHGERRPGRRRTSRQPKKVEMCRCRRTAG